MKKNKMKKHKPEVSDLNELIEIKNRYEKLYIKYRELYIKWSVIGVFCLIIIGSFLVFFAFQSISESKIINEDHRWNITKEECWNGLTNDSDYLNCILECRINNIDKKERNKCIWNCTIENKTYCENKEVDVIIFDEKYCEINNCAYAIADINGAKFYGGIYKDSITKEWLNKELDNGECKPIFYEPAPELEKQGYHEGCGYRSSDGKYVCPNNNCKNGQDVVDCITKYECQFGEDKYFIEVR
jgi:hypothetical protein